MRLKISRLVSLVRDVYQADKAYYRRLIVRAIEDGIVIYVMFAICWALAWAVSGILQKLGVGT